MSGLPVHTRSHISATQVCIFACMHTCMLVSVSEVGCVCVCACACVCVCVCVCVIP